MAVAPNKSPHKEQCELNTVAHPIGRSGAKLKLRVRRDEDAATARNEERASLGTRSGHRPRRGLDRGQQAVHMLLQPLDLLAILFIELRILLLMKFDILCRYPRADARGTLKEVIRFNFWHSPTG